MLPLRFRLRTIMFAVAALAVLTGLVRVLALCAGISKVGLEFYQSDPCLQFDVVSNRSYAAGPGGSILIVNRSTYFFPLKNFVALATVVITIGVLATCFLHRRPERGKRSQPQPSAPMTEPMPCVPAPGEVEP
jgi:hypothetical protein